MSIEEVEGHIKAAERHISEAKEATRKDSLRQIDATLAQAEATLALLGEFSRRATS